MIIALIAACHPHSVAKAICPGAKHADQIRSHTLSGNHAVRAQVVINKELQAKSLAVKNSDC